MPAASRIVGITSIRLTGVLTMLPTVWPGPLTIRGGAGRLFPRCQFVPGAVIAHVETMIGKHHHGRVIRKGRCGQRVQESPGAHIGMIGAGELSPDMMAPCLVA